MLQRPRFQSPNGRRARLDSPRLRRFVSALLVAVAVGLVAGCDDPGGPPDSWADVSLEDQPRLFESRRGHPALSDIDDLYLGQSREGGLETIDRYCGDDVIERGEGLLGGDASFRGCRVDEEGTVKFVRAGFWPRLDDRVSTLEVKRSSVPPAAVYESIRRLMDDDPKKKVLRDQIVQLEYRDYRFFADWDEGLDGPTHLTVGFDPEIPVERVTSRP